MYVYTYLIHVLIVPPAHVHILEAAVLGVHSELSVKSLVVTVRVVLEEAMVDDGLVVRAPHGECVTCMQPFRTHDQ